MTEWQSLAVSHPWNLSPPASPWESDDCVLQVEADGRKVMSIVRELVRIGAEIAPQALFTKEKKSLRLSLYL